MADQVSIESLIEQWFIDYFHNSPISRQAELYNVAYKAKEDLKTRLNQPVSSTTDDEV